MVAKCLEAADRLLEEGISAAVIDMHTIKPIDRELIIRKARETGAILTAEEHSVLGGLGSAVCEVVCEEYPIPVERMGLNDVFGQSGSPDELLNYYGLTVEKIIENARILIKKK
jgi:transketolase